MRLLPVLKRAFSLLLLVLTAALFAFFAVANRDTVTVHFSPLPYSADLPKYLLVIIAIGLGALLCSFFTGMSLVRHMLARFANRRKIHALENEVDGLRLERTPQPADGH